MAWTIGVDVGGTFTDFYALDEASGAVRVEKRPSTPDDPGRAILDGLAALAARHAIPPAEVRRFSHGTTVATNALIQRRGGRVALVTTKGFRDLLEIGRQTRPHMYDLYRDHPPPLVPRRFRLELDERIDAAGKVLRAPDDAAIADIVAQVRETGARACAICFLFAFLNPAHERRLADALRAADPGLLLSLSSEVQPEFREYERFSTTVLNAYLQAVMHDYVEKLEAGLAEAVPNATLGINQSSGGLMSLATARDFPVRTALSGPAAGVVGALHVAKSARRPNVITLDMGGTSADVALVRDGHADIAFDRSVAGFPIRLAMVDINTVGAGGGSIAWFDRDGLMKVGPLSAGADPGPACYGRGGAEPTVSDANLILGRLSPRGLLDGQMALDAQLARTAFAPAAERLGFSVERTAHGMLGIVVANMVRAIRTISVERGHDPRRFALMPFGGAGPLHARDVAAALGISEILVPPAPGIVCAQGLVVSDLKEDFVVSQRTPVADPQVPDIQDMVAALRDQAAAWFDAEDIPDDDRIYELSLDMRYVGQNFELAVPFVQAPRLAPGDVPDAGAMRRMFFAAHDRAYGYHNPDDPVEVVNVRLTARGRLYREPAAPADDSAPPAPEPFETRPVYFSDFETPLETPVYDRARLSAGQLVSGPAIVEQLDATTPVWPGDRATVDAAGNIVIEVRP
ncbi:MAG: hydantoinase/oxoprolinase family protein [Rhodospirillales bacterium]|nr:MAG: hydantoinase/oxoprolinase family protein [Rhodospirillales bacterium]